VRESEENGYRLETGDRFSATVRDFSLLHNAQTGSEAQPDFYSMSTGGSFLGNKRTGG
jgi:hypothetical protein